MNGLRIAIADDEARMRDYLWSSLERLGHQVVAAAKTGQELLLECREKRPQLIITDIKMPDMDGLEAAAEICRERAVPFVILSAYHDPEFVERALKQQVLAYLVKPLKDQSLKTAIQLAMRRFQEFQALQQQSADLRQALEDRKIVERAKGILMTRAELSEPDAFRRLQLLSSQKNKKMIEIARTIVEAEEALKL